MRKYVIIALFLSIISVAAPAQTKQEIKAQKRAERAETRRILDSIYNAEDEARIKAYEEKERRKNANTLIVTTTYASQGEAYNTLINALLDSGYLIAEKDKEFYTMSNGGVTLSGGECLIQADFCAELLKELKKNDIHTAVDTCGFVSEEAIEKVMPYTDIFLYDIKAFDEDVHIRCTGQSNKLILKNLEYIDGCGKKVEIRIPYVPGFNDSQISKIAEFLSGLKNITKVRVLPYHNFAGTKYMALNIKNTLPKVLPVNDEIVIAESYLKKYGVMG